MKNTTKAIYNLITNESFTGIPEKINNSISKNGWAVAERNEVTLEEVIEELPNLVDVVKQNIEDGSLDLLPMNVRQQILSILQAINGVLSSIYQNQQQFPALQDQFQALKQQIYIYRIDFTARKIPRYKEKIREYDNLVSKLKRVSTFLGEAQKTQEVIEVYANDIKEISNKSKRGIEDVGKNKDEINLLRKETKSLLQDVEEAASVIKAQKDNIIVISDEVKDSRSEIKSVESEVKTVQKNIDSNLKQYEKRILDAETTIKSFENRTNLIIEKNQEQQVEIDNQLQKAVGVSLFSTFETRKSDLNESLNNWLKAIAILVVILVLLSGWIAIDLYQEKISWIAVLVKLAISFPLIYSLIFLSSRYTKERRLVEEYAFKSTISLALSPYADLVKKVEDDGVDSKYRDFLISSIQNIFSVPTDKAFGFTKEPKNSSSENTTESIGKVLDLVEKTKKLTKPSE